MEEEVKEKKTANRKQYFQEYYQKNKSKFTCEDCRAEFIHPSCLKHHQRKNWQCMIKQLVDAWRRAETQFPEECRRIEPLVLEKIEKLGAVKEKAT